MGTWIGTVVIDDVARACIVDSLTERVLPLPLFATPDDADAFLTFAEELGFQVRYVSPSSLERLYTAWLASREVDREEARHAHP